jgi:predicted nucleic acid-binding Zn ribbon protein
MKMCSSDKSEEWKKSRRNERALMCLCFLASALIGYVLTNHVALLGF